LINGYANALYPGAPSSVTPSNFAGTLSQIGLRVTNNILAPAFLSVSDRRIKNVLPATSVTDDLQTGFGHSGTSLYLQRIILIRQILLRVSLPRKWKNMRHFAVHTTTEAIPSVLRYATSISSDGTVVNVVNNLVNGTNLSALTGKRIKVILPDGGIWNGMVATVEQVDQDHAILRLDPSNPLPSSAVTSPSSVFVYGEYVSDFKLLDTERLVTFSLQCHQRSQD